MKKIIALVFPVFAVLVFLAKADVKAQEQPFYKGPR